MKKTILFLTLLLTAKVNFAQYLNYNLYEILHNEDVKSSPAEFDDQYMGLLGTGFLSEKWMPGRSNTAMKNYPGLTLKFDVYTNKIYLNNKDTIYDISSSGIIQFDLFTVQGDTTKYQTFINGYNFGDVVPAKFIEMLTDGKITFLEYHVKSLEEVYESSPYDKQKKFIDKNKYYILIDGNTPTEVTVNKKNIEKILTDKWEEINKYARSHALNMNTEGGWQKAIIYYNTLK